MMRHMYEYYNTPVSTQEVGTLLKNFFPKIISEQWQRMKHSRKSIRRVSVTYDFNRTKATNILDLPTTQGIVDFYIFRANVIGNCISRV